MSYNHFKDYYCGTCDSTQTMQLAGWEINLFRSTIMLYHCLECDKIYTERELSQLEKEIDDLRNNKSGSGDRIKR